jgi:hypothetical protein
LFRSMGRRWRELRLPDIFACPWTQRRSRSTLGDGWRRSPDGVVRIVFVVPTETAIARASAPDWSWGRRLRALEARSLARMTVTALLSTLGGGHFACGQTTEARAMAASLMEVAMRGDDATLATQCVVHLAFSDMKTGATDLARTRLHGAIADAASLENEALGALCRAGLAHVDAMEGTAGGASPVAKSSGAFSESVLERLSVVSGYL